jgi:hypothetical protein
MDYHSDATDSTWGHSSSNGVGNSIVFISDLTGWIGAVRSWPEMGAGEAGKLDFDDQSSGLVVACVDAASMKSYDFLRDCEADACAAGTMLSRIAKPIERAKDIG